MATRWKKFRRDHRPECRKCPRFKVESDFVPPEIKLERGGVLVLLEAPGKDEMTVEPKRPAVGRAGQQLNDLLANAGMHRREVHVVNTCMCGTWEENYAPTPEEMECCAGLVNDAIEQADPDVIVAAGDAAMTRMLGAFVGEGKLRKKRSLVEWRGSIETTSQCVVVGEKKGLTNERYKGGKNGPHQVCDKCGERNTKSAKKCKVKGCASESLTAVEGAFKPGKVGVTIEQRAGRCVIPTNHPAALLYSGGAEWPLVVADLTRARRLAYDEGLYVCGEDNQEGVQNEQRLAEYIAGRDTICIDVETTPEGKLTLIGVARSPDDAATFRPSKRSGRVLREWAKDRGERSLVVAHNAPFDIRRLRTVGFDYRGRVFDTFHAAQFERPDIRQNTQSRRDASEEGVKWNKLAGLDQVCSRMEKLWYENWKEKFGTTSLDEAHYCRMDAAHEFYLFNEISRRLAKTGRLDHFNDVLMPMLGILTEIEDEGVQVDVRKLRRFIERQQAVTQRYYDIWDKHAPTLNGERLSLTQTQKLMTYYYDVVGLEEQYIGRGRTRRRTLNAEALEALAATYPDRVELRAIVAARHADKVLNTYLLRLADGIDSDERFGFEYNLSGTYTGRLSGDAQQFPRPTKDGKCEKGVEGCLCGRLRELIVADEGDVGLAVSDYSQIEARLTAIYAGEDWLVEEFENPEFDFHQQTGDYLADMIGGEWASYDAKQRRTLGKKGNHAFNYVMTWVGIMKHFGCGKNTAQRIENAIHDMRPRTVGWWRELEKECYQNGYVSNAWGRRFYFRPTKWDYKTQTWKFDLAKLVASVPQSSAGEVIYGAMIRARNEGLKLRFQAHDELGVSMEYEDDGEVLKECMEYEVEKLGGWKCSADLGIGDNWREAKLNG